MPEMDSAVHAGDAKHQSTERLSIKMQDIPTELLERLLGDFVQQVNRTYRKTQGDLAMEDVDAPTSTPVEKPEGPKKRRLAEINSSVDPDRLMHVRAEYSNGVLKNYMSPGSGISTITEQRGTSNEPMANILSLCVLEILKTSIASKYDGETPDIRESSLSLLAEWTTQYIHLLSVRLQRLMEIQRRRLPNRCDLSLLEREGYFNRSGIQDMYEQCRSWNSQTENAEKSTLMVNKANVARTAYNGSDGGMFNDDVSNVDSKEQWWIDQIIHRKKRKNYIPEWMPPLPPDYTFKSTPKFSERVSNPVVLREKLVAEGRLGEKALDHIIPKEDGHSPFSSDSISSDSLSADEESGVESEMEAAGEGDVKADQAAAEKDVQESEKHHEPDVGSEKNEETEKVGLLGASESATTEIPSTDETAVGGSSGEDLVALAKKRTMFLDQRRKEEEERYLSRVDCDESYFGRNFGFYSNLKKLPNDIKDELNDYRSKHLHDLIRDLHRQEKRNIKWALEQEELRKKLDDEKSKYADANEIQIGGSGSGDGHNGFFYDNVDEEVDFDVEFSDMEDFQEPEHSNNDGPAGAEAQTKEIQETEDREEDEVVVEEEEEEEEEDDDEEANGADEENKVEEEEKDPQSMESDAMRHEQHAKKTVQLAHTVPAEPDTHEPVEEDESEEEFIEATVITEEAVDREADQPAVTVENSTLRSVELDARSDENGELEQPARGDDGSTATKNIEEEEEEEEEDDEDIDMDLFTDA